MRAQAKLTILVENTASRNDLQAEHGLAFWIEYAGKSILWDTGQSDILLQNAQVLGIDLKRADAIVLSHGHYDHTGGLSAVRHQAPQVPVYLHPAAIKAKYSQKASSVRYIGMSDAARQVVRSGPVVWTQTPLEILPGMWITGQVPRVTPYEDTGGAFFRDADCRVKDNLPDDQSLFIETEKGLVVVLGCGHSGVVNILDFISRLSGKKEIYAVIGGMHLLNADSTRIDRTIAAFRKYRVQIIVPLHCTGFVATEAMKNVSGSQCISMGGGGQIDF
jgi:7,8-dihydropterin-6-yl-methyl-4-(beta-D-ribofuranosyl)aminobenzene 5'-phosphate synthase